MTAIPPTPEAIDTRWLEAALSEPFPGTRVASVGVEALSHGTNDNARLRVAYTTAAGAPEHFFAKCPPTDPRQRNLVLESGMGRREVLFYRHLANRVPMRVPRGFVAQYDSSDGRFALLVEDLEMSGCSFPSDENGVGLQLAESAMANFADLHALFRPGAEAAPDWIEPPLRQPAYARAMLEHALSTRSETLTSAYASIARLYIEYGEAVHDLWEEGSPVATHGDAHLANLFIDGDCLGFLDWGCFAWAPAMRDVGYFLCMALSIADRRRHERELIGQYLEHRRRAEGDAPSLEDAWTAHRLQASYAVIAAAPAVLNPRRPGDASGAYAADFVARASAAVEDLETVPLLRSRLGL